MRIFSFQKDNENLWRYWSNYIKKVDDDAKSLYNYMWYFKTEYQSLINIDLFDAGLQMQITQTDDNDNETDVYFYFPILLDYHQGLVIGQDGFLCFDAETYINLKANVTLNESLEDLKASGKIVEISAGNIVYSMVQPVAKSDKKEITQLIEHPSTIQVESYDASAFTTITYDSENEAMNFTNDTLEDTISVTGLSTSHLNDLFHEDRAKKENYLIVGLATAGYYILQGTNFNYNPYGEDEYGKKLILNFDITPPRYFFTQNGSVTWKRTGATFTNILSSQDEVTKNIDSSNKTSWTNTFPLMHFIYYTLANDTSLETPDYHYEEMILNETTLIKSDRNNLDKMAILYYNIQVDGTLDIEQDPVQHLQLEIL